MATINHLPVEILTTILSYIDIVERQHLQGVSKQWKSIIEQMSSRLERLKFDFTLRNKLQPCKRFAAGRIHAMSNNESSLATVLKIFNGNLTKFDMNYQGLRWAAPNYILELVKQNKNLISVKIRSLIHGVFRNYIECLPTEHLRHLSMSNKFSSRGSSTKAIEDLLTKANALEFLHICRVSTSMLHIIGHMESLKSLHFEYAEYSLDSPKLNITSLRNLETLNLGAWSGVDNYFLTQLPKRCEKLRRLKISCNSVTSTGFDAIGLLNNLYYLELSYGTIENSNFLSQLSNLQFLYLNEIQIEQNDLSRSLQCLTNLKKIYTSDINIQKFLSDIGFADKLEVRYYSEALLETDWINIFEML